LFEVTDRISSPAHMPPYSSEILGPLYLPLLLHLSWLRERVRVEGRGRGVVFQVPVSIRVTRPPRREGGLDRLYRRAGGIDIASGPAGPPLEQELAPEDQQPVGCEAPVRNAPPRVLPKLIVQSRTAPCGFPRLSTQCRRLFASSTVGTVAGRLRLVVSGCVSVCVSVRPPSWGIGHLRVAVSLLG